MKKEWLMGKAEAVGILEKLTPEKKPGVMHCHRLPFA
jgi:hypothetical protein